MSMHEQFKKELNPDELSWIILNNLEKFNGKESYIFALFDKVKLLHIDYEEPRTHYQYYEKACKFFIDHNHFPDFKLLKAGTTGDIKEYQGIDNFSMYIYEDYIEHLNRLIIRHEVRESIANNSDLTTEDCQEAIQKLTKFIARNNVNNILPVEGCLNRIIENVKNCTGVKTLIKQIDEVINVLRDKNLSILAGIQGHGKSTWASSIAYNAAVFQGKCVDFVAFEENEDELWSRVLSIESHYLGFNISASDIIEGCLTEEQIKQLQICEDELNRKLKDSGGNLRMLDDKTMSATTYEEMCSTLERLAEDTKVSANLIIIDNVNCFSKFHSSIKDPYQKVNEMIVKLEGFSKSYMSYTGACILLLAQINREGSTKLIESNQPSESGKKKKKITISHDVLAEYNQLERKASTIIILYADEFMRSLGKGFAYVTKCRWRPPRSSEPLIVPVDYSVSYVGGDLMFEENVGNPLEAISKKNECVEDLDPFEDDDLLED